MSEIREVLFQSVRGVSNRGIARSLGLSRNTINNYVRLGKKFGLSPLSSNETINRIALQIAHELYENKGRESQINKLLSKHHSTIKSYLEEKHMTQTQIHRKLKEVHGFTVNERSLNRYIATYFPPKIKSTVHLITIAGDEAQVDYGYVGLMKGADGKSHKTYAFVMTLSHSRHRYVEFVQSQNQRSWCQSHINAFEFFGAVPKRILLDNLKAGVIKPHIYDPTLNMAYEELSRFYNVILDPAKVRQPQHKGKVERSVLLVKQQLIAGCHYNSLEEANKAALHWCSNEINERICSTTGERPSVLFEQEDKPNMQALPEKSFDLPTWTIGRVHKDHHVTVKKNFYSVPTEYIGEDVSIRIGLRTVEIYVSHQLIKTHLRNMDSGQWVTDEQDYSLQAQKYLTYNPEYCIEKAKGIGESVLTMVSVVLTNPSNTNLRKSQAILRLIDTYGAKRLDDACLRAVAFDNYEYDALVRILDFKLDSKNTKSCSTKVIDSHSSAYLRSANEYSSSMEVNYG